MKNDENLSEMSLGSGNVQKSSEKSEVLDSRFHGNDGISDGIRPPRHSRAGGNLVMKNDENLSEMVRFRLFTINSYCFSFPDSHFRGNDGGEDKFSQSKTSSFP
ncbi:hypothetical protein [Neisseria meningitidis]|uniref:hypothetical protein n=1 Tax=Neisseria meningitidis TaxID=487 RepID=UPI001E2A0DC0|nr:hypothetical protein [Neisseria meningitidis]